jgi:hypothetical protein
MADPLGLCVREGKLETVADHMLTRRQDKPFITWFIA